MTLQCPKCRAKLMATSKEGRPMMRGRGLVLKSSGLEMICPRCRSGVPLTQDALKALQTRIVAFFERRG